MAETASAPAPQVLPQALLIDAAGAARLCGIGRTLWLQMASAGRVPMPIRLGRRTLWQREELAAWTKAGCPGRDRWTAIWEKTHGRA